MHLVKNDELRIKNEELLLHHSSIELPKTVLTIAGHDPTSGAGVTSDLKTFQYFGVYGLSVITALTVQNTHGVIAVNPVDASIVKAQLDALASDMHIDGIKIGMLPNEGILKCVASFVADHPAHIVLDPILATSNGVRLLNRRGIAVLKRELLPLTEMITPNYPETVLLTEITLDSDEKVFDAAEKLQKMGARNVLIKGGHSEDQEYSRDFFLEEWFYEWLNAPRSPKQVHGTGCLVSAAIAALLASGDGERQSVICAKNFVTKMIKGAIAFGSGQELFRHTNIEPFFA
jgi:hydroxymethylpyrimidine/phosphomethylpyrimidine kinase